VFATELDDSILKRTDPRVNAHLYQLLNVFHKISKKFNIRYWAECGTLLGYKRHGGIIPWDDDADVDIHPDDFSKLSDIELLKEISKYGYELCPIYLGYRLCPQKLPSFGRAVENDTTQNVEYNWPFLDIFATSFFDKTGSGKLDHIRYKDKGALKWWPDYYLTKNEVKQLIEVEFGPEKSKIRISIPQNIDDYLNRIFGFEHMEIAYQEWDHANNCAIKKQMCKVIDREPGKVVFAEMPLD